ncbi:DUF262 domain-containing protein [Myroides sp. BIT-d1]|uniref:DUF262 domain-containing protein n=1 Tax=Myroides albus TaxID=2562892 RepID=A0A6I3LN19_9FLAO|nr:DUF262 domain-containing protein [Myroides albus]MTG99117.1 DUF262 domain-containing protein [Myroides albus]
MKTYTLQDLLSNQIEFEYNDQVKSYSFQGISIPIIQRDYAQGRMKEMTLRKRFLNSIFRCLRNNELLELDFVYGSVSQLNETSFFQPLDGQQRLTTLFLLNWYIINKELKDQLRQEKLTELERFSYETRITSLLFCQKLCSIGFSENPRKEIENSYWFHSGFENDPTVVSMLQMLDDINLFYTEYNQEKESYYERLSNLRFYVLPLDGFNLSDELYIKMNDRGKQLSHFENFKADFINWMKLDSNETTNNFHSQVEYKGKKMPFYLRIASKLDNDWSDIFWKKALSKQNEKSLEYLDTSDVDSYFFNFINNFLLGEFISVGNQINENSEGFKFLYNSQSNKYFGWSNYEGLVNYTTIIRLELFLDRLKIDYNLLKSSIAASWNVSFQWFIDDLEMNQVNRILYHAIYKYLLNNTFNEKSFKEWIRVVWNIISDPDIRTISAMINGIRVIDNISAFSNNILLNLNEGLLDDYIYGLDDSFYKTQLIEERQKAVFILENDYEVNKRYKEIVETEKHFLFKGSILFILRGVSTVDQLIHNRNIAFFLFNDKGAFQKIDNQDHVLLRYVISRFKNLDEIKSINYRDTYDYWQLLLRRNENLHIQNTVSSLFEQASIEDVQNELLTFISRESNILDEKILHTNLYYYNDFHRWIQKNGLDELRGYYFNYYINRSYSSNDRVLIDNYRNELITKVIHDLGFFCGVNCGNTGFYKGKDIDCEKRYEKGYHITIKFLESNNLIIGLWSGHNFELKNKEIEGDYWLYKYEIKNQDLKSIGSVENVYKTIVYQIEKIKDVHMEFIGRKS